MASLPRLGSSGVRGAFRRRALARDPLTPVETGRHSSPSNPSFRSPKVLASIEGRTRLQPDHFGQPVRVCYTQSDIRGLDVGKANLQSLARLSRTLRAGNLSMPNNAPPEWASQLEQPASRMTQETLRGSQKIHEPSRRLQRARKGC